MAILSDIDIYLLFVTILQKRIGGPLAKKNNSDSTDKYGFKNFENLRRLLSVAPPLRQGYIASPELDPPPELPPVFEFEIGLIQKPLMEMMGIYLGTILDTGMTYESLHLFERGLAFDFAFLLRVLTGLDRKQERLQVLEAFLQYLRLPVKRGKRRKSPQQLKSYSRGMSMRALWTEEVQPAWNLKKSLERQGRDAKERLRKSGVEGDVIKEILRPQATCKSSLARIYSRRANVSYGAARNALLEYLKLEDLKLSAHV